MSKCGIITENEDGTKKLASFVPWLTTRFSAWNTEKLDGGPGDGANMHVRSQDWLLVIVS